VHKFAIAVDKPARAHANVTVDVRRAARRQKRRASSDDTGDKRSGEPPTPGCMAPSAPNANAQKD
jgi:hypothetical protein